MSKLKNHILNFTWDLVATSCHNPKKFIFNSLSYELSSSDKDLLSKGLHFAIPPKQIDFSNFTTEFELLCRSTLDLSMTSGEKNCFNQIKLKIKSQTKLKDIALISFKLFNENCKFANTLSADEINLKLS